MNTIEARQHAGWFWAAVAVTVAGVALLVFWNVWQSGICLFSTDDNIGAVVESRRSLTSPFVGLWGVAPLMGAGGGIQTLSWSALTRWVLSPVAFVNTIHALNLALGALMLVTFLRRRGVSAAAATMGALAAFWVGSNLTLVYAGHVLKFDILFLSALLLVAIDICSRHSRPVARSLLAGAVAGLMLIEQQDVALFFGLFLGAYAVLRVFRAESSAVRRTSRALATFLPMGAVVLLLAGPSLLGSYATNVKGVASVSDENPQAKWEFCTQWSVPVDETIDLIAPGYTGWRSGEPEGPYWGRTGQSANWDQTRQGFMNFRLESIYIGAIPVVLALFAVAAALWGGRGGGWKVEGGSQKTANSGQRAEVGSQRSEVGGQRADVTVSSPPSTLHLPPSTILSDRRSEILFWGAAALIALLLAYGKYFPLYALFYQLPLVNSIRNPNKFIQVFQLCLGILAAYGLDAALRCQKSVNSKQ